MYEVSKLLHDLGLHIDPNHAPVRFEVLHPLQGCCIDQVLLNPVLFGFRNAILQSEGLGLG